MSKYINILKSFLQDIIYDLQFFKSNFLKYSVSQDNTWNVVVYP